METKTIRIETKRLVLRKITLDDALPMYHNWASDDEVTKYLSWKTHKNIDVTKGVIASWIKLYEQKKFFQWVIELKENQKVIGTISLFGYKNNSLEVGYCISREYWNQGITTEACYAVLKFAFSKIGVEKVFSKHIVENIASGKVMEKNNMTYINTKEEYVFSKKKIVQMKNYVINKEDFK